MKKHAVPLSAILVLVILCLVSPSSALDPPRKPGEAAGKAEPPLVGSTYGPGVIAGYEDLGGGVMADTSHRLTGFAIQHVRRGETEMIWLSRVVGTDPAGMKTCRILDVLVLPPREQGEILARFACFFAGRRNDSIIAYTDRYYYRIRRAWVADTHAGRIREVSPRGIVCQDPAVAGMP